MERREYPRVKGGFKHAWDVAMQVMRIEKDRILSQEWEIKLKDDTNEPRDGSGGHSTTE